MLFQAVSLVLLATSAFASPIASPALPTRIPVSRPQPTVASSTADPTLPYNPALPASTPLFQVVNTPPVLPVQSVAHLGRASVPRRGSPLYNAQVALNATLNSTLQSRARLAVAQAALPACLDSTANDTVINTLFFYGATTVYLCPTAVIPLNFTILFFEAGQTLTTQPNSQGLRGTLKIVNPAVSCAIYAVDVRTSGATISNIQIDGSRPELGWVAGAPALMELGGNSLDLTVTNVHAFEPRGWSILHVMEGYKNLCSNAKITNNQFEKSGHAPSGASQFKRDTGTYAAGQWADGISLACPNSLVEGNVITDATDGGIVLFAPGCTIRNNVIIAQDRQLLGGINFFDWGPFQGNYTNTVATGNIVNAQGSMIKIGIAIGTLSWQSYNVTWGRGYGATITNNQLTSGAVGYFGYGITAQGMNATAITGNNFVNANFGGVATAWCDGYYPLPPAGPMYYGAYTTPGCTLDPGFVAATFDFAICTGPGPITKSRYTRFASRNGRERAVLELGGGDEDTI